MAAPRRIGASGSQTRARLLDAAEQVILNDGYAAASSRRVAARAGLKPQLVHYYFRSMEDLFIEVFRRRADQNLARFARALTSDRPLRRLWELSTDPRGTAFTMEFVALANHRKTIRTEIARYAERFRAMQLEAINRALAANGISREACPPVALLLAMTGVSQTMAIERSLGVTVGHEEMLALVDRYLGQLEDEHAPAAAPLSSRSTEPATT